MKSVDRKSRTHSEENDYFEALAIAYEMINAIRLGPLSWVGFRWGEWGSEPALKYSSAYRPIAQEIALYSFALRQCDPLGEYLGYYRVLESATNSNAKSWIAANVGRLTTEDFGFPPLRRGSDMFQSSSARSNLFSLRTPLTKSVDHGNRMYGRRLAGSECNII